MSKFCSQCGNAVADGAKHCPQCGASLNVPADKPVGYNHNVQQQYQQQQQQYQPQQYQQMPRSAPAPTKAFDKKAKKAAKPKKGKAKSGIKRPLITLGVFAGIAALCTFLVFAFGNYFTLIIHTNDDLKVLNNGTLDFSDIQRDTYEDLPLYVKEMMGEGDAEADAPGPIVSAMAPHVTFERTKIHGFFGGREVEYRVVSRDIGSWLLTLDYSSISSQEQLQSMILEYIPNAPRKEYFVKVKYYKDGIFGWNGDYETPEIADAITGGLNTAYNALYVEMMRELEELLG